MVHPSIAPRIILDVDDLMSRRSRNYLRFGIGLELGALGSVVAPLKIIGRLFSNCILSLEAGRMWRNELAAIASADEVLFSSDYERQLIERKNKHLTRCSHRHIVGYKVRPLVPNLSPDRLVFGFVGGDKLVQNQRSIEALIRLWVRHSLPHKLVIVGKCHRQYEPCKNVEFAGYVPNLSERYSGFDALIVFSYVPGGLKTKIPEALAYGLPVILNNVAAEGIVGLRDYNLRFNEEGLIRYLKRPMGDIRRDLLSCRSTSIELAQKYWSTEKFESLFRHLIQSDRPCGTSPAL
jgi:glycosyltransferase involved in cell wall biosynthesis